MNLPKQLETNTTRLLIISMMMGMHFISCAQGPEVKKNLKELDRIITAGDLDSAEDKLMKLTESHPEEIEYLVRYGSVLIQKDDSTGIIHLEKVVTLDPDHLFAHKEAGRFYMMQGVRNNSLLERASTSKSEKISELKKIRDEALGKMTQHYEQVIRLDSKDQLTLQALMNVYGLLEDEENFNRIVQKMDALKNHQ